jgi:hypothetical protein
MGTCVWHSPVPRACCSHRRDIFHITAANSLTETNQQSPLGAGRYEQDISQKPTVPMTALRIAQDKQTANQRAELQTSLGQKAEYPRSRKYSTVLPWKWKVGSQKPPPFSGIALQQGQNSSNVLAMQQILAASCFPPPRFNAPVFLLLRSRIVRPRSKEQKICANFGGKRRLESRDEKRTRSASFSALRSLHGALWSASLPREGRRPLTSAFTPTPVIDRVLVIARGRRIIKGQTRLPLAMAAAIFSRKTSAQVSGDSIHSPSIWDD